MTTEGISKILKICYSPQIPLSVGTIPRPRDLEWLVIYEGGSTHSADFQIQTLSGTKKPCKNYLRRRHPSADGSRSLEKLNRSAHPRQLLLGRSSFPGMIYSMLRNFTRLPFITNGNKNTRRFPCKGGFSIQRVVIQVYN